LQRSCSQILFLFGLAEHTILNPTILRDSTVAIFIISVLVNRMVNILKKDGNLIIKPSCIFLHCTGQILVTRFDVMDVHPLQTMPQYCVPIHLANTGSGHICFYTPPLSNTGKGNPGWHTDSFASIFSRRFRS